MKRHRVAGFEMKHEVSGVAASLESMESHIRDVECGTPVDGGFVHAAVHWHGNLILYTK